MPVGDQNGWNSDRFISTDDIRRMIQTLGDLRPIGPSPLDGPAERFALEGGKGEIGFIGAMSNHFCTVCNRLRLTAEGHLRSCLFSEEEIDIKGPLRSGQDDNHLLELIRLAIERKPKDHGPLGQGPRKCVRQMSTIGG